MLTGVVEFKLMDSSFLKKTWLGICLALCVVPAVASAHTFRSDGPITVLLHIDPQDDPVATSHSSLSFYVFDSQRKFLGANCACAVKVTLGSKVLLDQSVAVADSGNNHVGVVPFAFPGIGDYHIVFSGQPKPGADFHTFSLDYSQQVDLTGYRSDSKSALPFVLTGSLVVVTLGVIVVAGKRQFRSSRS